MMKTWMNKTLLAVSVQMILGVAYAAEEPSLGGYETVGETVTEQAGSDQKLCQSVSCQGDCVGSDHCLYIDLQRCR